MPRRRRVIVSGKPYEVIPRARECLPLPPNKTTNAIRLGIFARAQRDEKVHLCNLVCMNSHDHMQVVPKKPGDLPKFYGEVLKKTTDALKTLTGNKTLRIWEDRVTVMMLASLDDAIERLVYLFCNPSKAGLSDSIDTYQGINSWKAFCTCEASVNAKVTVDAPWHRVEGLPRVGKKGISRDEDRRYCEMLSKSKSAVKHTLAFEPFAWLEAFGVSDPRDIEEVRQTVIRKVREREAEYRAERQREGRTKISKEALNCQPHLDPHTPKKKERKIFLICSDKDSRISWIRFHDNIDAQCKECYELAKAGIATTWPPGTFVPWLSPTECYTCE